MIRHEAARALAPLVRRAVYWRPGRGLLVLGCFASLVACGGGDDPGAMAQHAARRQALAGTSDVPAATITPDQLFAWAQIQYPELFGDRPPVVISNLSYQGKVFDVRAYATGNYLGESGGEAFGYGPFTDYQLVSFGPVAQFREQVCTKLSCVLPSGEAPPNDCTLRASLALAPGHQYQLVYGATGVAPPGDKRVEARVDEGTYDFAGQSAVRTLVDTTATSQVTLNGTLRSVTTTTQASVYAQPTASGLVRLIGTETEATTSPLKPGLPGLTTRTTLVYDPADIDIEMALPLGLSLDKTVSSTTTVTFPPPTSVDAKTVTSTHTFEGRETITVPAGTFATCRYARTEADGTVSRQWLLIGKGVVVREQTGAGAALQGFELSSGSFDGAPL